MQLYTRKLASSRVRPATNYAVGTLDGGALYLAPLRTTYQMRPSFAYVDADTDDAHVDDRGQSATAPAPKLQAVSIKRAPTSREVAIQRTSYAFKRQEQDAEPWHELAIAHREHSGARAKRARLSVAILGSLSSRHLFNYKLTHLIVSLQMLKTNKLSAENRLVRAPELSLNKLHRDYRNDDN